MSRFVTTTDTSVRCGMFRRTFEMTLGTRERQNQRHASPILYTLDDQACCDRAYGQARRRGVTRHAHFAAI